MSECHICGGETVTGGECTGYCPSCEKKNREAARPKEKRYAVVEVGGRNCAFMANDNICVLDGNCATCTHGQTLSEMVEKAEDKLKSGSFREDSGGLLYTLAEEAISILIPQEEK